MKKLYQTYRFPLNGIHQLRTLNEPIHGHGADLLISVELPMKDEAQFLSDVKNRILRNFHLTPWIQKQGHESTAENVILEINSLLTSSAERVSRVELVETKKNRIYTSDTKR